MSAQRTRSQAEWGLALATALVALAVAALLFVYGKPWYWHASVWVSAALLLAMWVSGLYSGIQAIRRPGQRPVPSHDGTVRTTRRRIAPYFAIILAVMVISYFTTQLFGDGSAIGLAIVPLALVASNYVSARRRAR
jgi:hypothetical protein